MTMGSHHRRDSDSGSTRDRYYLHLSNSCIDLLAEEVSLEGLSLARENEIDEYKSIIDSKILHSCYR